jgi:hypothetical protein
VDICLVGNAPHFEEVGPVYDDLHNEWSQKVILLALKPLKKRYTSENYLRLRELIRMQPLAYVDLQKCICDQREESVADTFAN